MGMGAGAGANGKGGGGGAGAGGGAMGGLVGGHGAGRGAGGAIPEQTLAEAQHLRNSNAEASGWQGEEQLEAKHSDSGNDNLVSQSIAQSIAFSTVNVNKPDPPSSKWASEGLHHPPKPTQPTRPPTHPPTHELARPPAHPPTRPRPQLTQPTHPIAPRTRPPTAAGLAFRRFHSSPHAPTHDTRPLSKAPNS